MAVVVVVVHGAERAGPGAHEGARPVTRSSSDITTTSFQVARGGSMAHLSLRSTHSSDSTGVAQDEEGQRHHRRAHHAHHQRSPLEPRRTYSATHTQSYNMDKYNFIVLI